MKLVHRLLLFSLMLVTIMVAFVMATIDMRLRDSVVNERAAELSREAVLVGGHWASGEAPIEAARRSSAALGGRVTLIDNSGIVVADAAEKGFVTLSPGARALRPEVQAARSGLIGIAIERMPEKGEPGIYVAVKTQPGIVRIGIEMSTLESIFDRARSDVVTVGFVALLWAGLFAIVFARYVSKPVTQLRDMARALARREFDGVVPLDAPGEVGDLAESLSQLSSRLQALERLRREFIVNVSHELSSPLTIASGFAATLARHDPPAESRKQFARAILSNTHRMQRVVENMLDLSRIETGSWIPRLDQVDLRETITDIFDAIGPAAEQKKISLRREVDDQHAVIVADPTWVRQIIGNLCENALRHTVRGEIVAAVTGTNEGTWLGVRDTGEGIAPYHLPRIFERLYRADQGRARPTGGSGLGLAIVKHMAEAHGGSVSAESEVGVGTTIRVFFPATVPEHMVFTPKGTPRLQLDPAHSPL
ncbi:MAG: HAMP domain-containing sensor histidine kinase [Gemmatimonadaceae bacterium]